jgi:2-polyprenyl-3-methyl-5-hydroxy-6-metoxy-1,4-benzoquinol methylase
MSTEIIDCPYCGSKSYKFWASERGFTVVRCACRLLYVNPRPQLETISEAVKTGVHGEEAGNINVVTRRVAAKVDRYQAIVRQAFSDVWAKGQPVSWLDVGAGFGEVVEAVTRVAPTGSRVEGVEPMHPKAADARSRGLKVIEGYLSPNHPKVDFVSSIDVFSHVPDYHSFLQDIRAVLNPGGEFFLETGNLADVERRADFPNELGVPDHLVFAGAEHIRGYLDQAGFDVVSIREERFDDWMNTVKSVVKKVIGREAVVAMPYTSPYRQLLVRARLR